MVVTGVKRTGILTEIWEAFEENRGKPRLVILPTHPIAMLYVDGEDKLRFFAIIYTKKKEKVAPGVYVGDDVIAANILKLYARGDAEKLKPVDVAELVTSILEREDVRMERKEELVRTIQQKLAK